MATNLSFVQKAKNALSGEEGNPCVGALNDACWIIREKCDGLEKKRKIIPLAFPAGLLRGILMIGAFYPAMAIDRIVRAIQFTRNPNASKKEKLRYWAILTIKLPIIIAAIPTGIALIPIYTIAYTISTLIRLRK